MAKEQAKWNWIHEVGNPEVADKDYLVLIVCPEFNDLKLTGKYETLVETRYFAKPGDGSDWPAFDADPSQPHWTEQTGSSWHEKVVAWMPIPEPMEPEDLPEWLLGSIDFRLGEVKEELWYNARDKRA